MKIVELKQIIAPYIEDQHIEFLIEKQIFSKPNWREILLTIKKWNSWDKNMETEIAGKEITDHVNDWLLQNTVNGKFSMADATENIIRCDQVRIPLLDANNNAIDARKFANRLQKYLKAAPYNIESKLLTRGLGEAILILGEK